MYANSQPVGKTDASGVAVIPRLSGFLPNTITFEAEDIPLEGSFGDNAKPVKIANRMGVLVDMGVLRRLSATLTLVRGERPAGAGGRLRAHRRGRGGVSGGPAGTRVRERPRARQAQCPACAGSASAPAAPRSSCRTGSPRDLRWGPLHANDALRARGVLRAAFTSCVGTVFAVPAGPEDRGYQTAPRVRRSARSMCRSSISAAGR